MNSNYIVIMAGGVGSRFWPASRESKPKQFLDILGIGKSLLRLTYERSVKIVPAENVFVITNEMYRAQVLGHIPEMKDHQVIGEPSRNNTAPCVAYTAFKIEAIDPNANLMVAPSDHYIHDEQEFVRVVKSAFEFTSKGDRILTLGMAPSRPDTGYGYIELGEAAERESFYKANRFTEKPDVETAKNFLSSGQYCWNSGMFFFSVKTILTGFEKHSNEIFSILRCGRGKYNTEAESEFVKREYPTTPNISIDYAIMEKAEHIYCLRADFGWSDLGTWGSLYDFSKNSEEDNVNSSSTDVTINSKGNLINVPKDKMVVLKDINDYFVIDTEDVLLIWPRKDEEELPAIRKSSDRK